MRSLWRGRLRDSPEALRERLQSAAAHQGLVKAVQTDIERIGRTIDQHATFAEAVANRGTMSALDMQLRKLHDRFGWDVRHSFCSGTLYRSTDAAALAADGKLAGNVLHCEHAIPNKVFARIVFERCRGASRAALADLLLTGPTVVMVTREERFGVLAVRRTYNGRTSAWSGKHPCMSEGSDGRISASDDTIVFARYVGTGVSVLWYPQGQEVSLGLMTWDEHRSRMRKFALFNWQTYFPDAAPRVATGHVSVTAK